MTRVCLDSTFFTALPDGSLTFKRTSVGLQQMLQYTTPGTFTFTKASFPGLTRLVVRAEGGGGGGAGADAAVGEAIARAGGGGGGYSESVLDASVIGATESITVGGGGLGGVGNDDGTNGGDSSFGGFVLARGGPGALSPMPSGTSVDARSGSPGAPPGVGQVRVSGDSGGSALRLNGTDIVSGSGGAGGGALGGGGGLSRAAESDGADGVDFGGGGGGAGSRGASRSGGKGAGGAVFVTLYF